LRVSQTSRVQSDPSLLLTSLILLAGPIARFQRTPTPHGRPGSLLGHRQFLILRLGSSDSSPMLADFGNRSRWGRRYPDPMRSLAYSPRQSAWRLRPTFPLGNAFEPGHTNSPLKVHKTAPKHTRATAHRPAFWHACRQVERLVADPCRPCYRASVLPTRQDLGEVCRAGRPAQQCRNVG